MKMLLQVGWNHFNLSFILSYKIQIIIYLHTGVFRTFWTVIPSLGGLLLVPPPALPCRLDSNVPNGLGR